MGIALKHGIFATDGAKVKIEQMTEAQRKAFARLLDGHTADARGITISPPDLPAGYVAVWARGAYYGIDGDGNASS